MPYKIAVASGKGGTGKTTVAVNLFTQLNKIMGGKVELVDCDVEEPNDVLFFEGIEKSSEQDVSQLIPHIDKDKCTYCRSCANYCEYNAIVAIPHINFIEVNKNLCHSCGACLVACKHNAITEHPFSIGCVQTYKTENSHRIKEGRLKIGSAMQTMLIKELKKHGMQKNNIVIYDAPPGTSCPVVETISDAHYVVLVTEPTPFGLHDLKLMVELVKQLELPFGVVVNKAGLGNKEIYEYLGKEKIDLLGEILFSKIYASLYAKGKIVENIPLDIQNSYLSILQPLLKRIKQHEASKEK